MFPLALAFDPAGFDAWKEGFQDHFDYDKDKIKFLNLFSRAIWQRFQQYKVPVIDLLRGTAKEAVCQVFEKVNTGGVTLTVFELVTATFASDDFLLREDWDARAERIWDHKPLTGIDGTDFLTTITLLASYKRSQATGSAVGCKRKDVLALKLDEYRENVDVLQDALAKAALLLTKDKVFDTDSLPYRTQLIPLGAIIAMLGNRFDEDAVRQKLLRWYWSGVFGDMSLRPMARAASAKDRRSSSVNRMRPLIFDLRILFSARRYSF